MVKVKVWSKVSEIENEKKVRKAIHNIFPTINLRNERGKIVGEGKKNDLEFLREKIWAKRILDTVRNSLLERLRGNKSAILLHKQAAFVGKIGIVENDEESPHGAIHVEIETNNFEEFLDWFSPKTKNGKPILRNR